jgi:AcrR family transcriptional regulator
MVAKTRFTKEQIIAAAFALAREEGLNGITVRKVAHRLGSSIAPIYVNFENVEALVQAVVQKIVAVSQQMLAEQNSGDPFQDLGIVSLRFAREYPQLFRDLVLNPNPYLHNYDAAMEPILLEQMRKDPHLASFSDQELREVLLKARIFQLGLSVMIANRLLPADFDEAQAIQLLHSAATDVVTGIWQRKNQT